LKRKSVTVVRVVHSTDLLRCDAITLGEGFSTFWKVVVPSSSRSTSSRLLVAWRWKHYLLKHSLKSEKTQSFNNTTLKISLFSQHN